MGRFGILVLGLMLVSAKGLQAQPSAGHDTPPRRASALAQRTLDQIRIDGMADEPVWQAASAVGGFRQYDPVPDANPSQPTEFRIVYDEDNLYLFVRAFDSRPDSIMRAPPAGTCAVRRTRSGS
jgi:hypothetical protein